MVTGDWLPVASPPEDDCDDESWDVVEVRRVVGVLLGEAEVDVAREGKGVSLSCNTVWGRQGEYVIYVPDELESDVVGLSVSLK